MGVQLKSLLVPLVLLLAAGAVGFLALEVLDLGGSGDDGVGTAGLSDGDMLEGSTEEAAAGPAALTGRAEALTPEERAARDRRLGRERPMSTAGRVVVPDGVPFQGEVLDPGETPAGGVHIVAVRQSAGGGTFEFLTNEAGKFETALPPGQYAFTFKLDGVGSRFVPRRLVDGSNEEPFVFQLQEPAKLEVALLRGEGGVPGSTVTLVARNATDAMALNYERTTDADGVATFEEIPRGNYQLTAAVADGPALSQQVRLTSDQTLKIAMPKGVRLSGKVISGPDGPPVVGAQITIVVQPNRTRTQFETMLVSGPDGTYDAVVPAGNLKSFTVIAEGYAPFPDPGSAAHRKIVRRGLRNLGRGRAAKLNVTLASGAALLGAVTDAEDAPVPGLVFQLKSNSRGTESQTVRTDKQGHYRVAELHPGWYDIWIESPGWFPEARLRVSIPKARGNPEPTTYDFKLEGARRVSGIVVGGGKAVHGARVWLASGGSPVYGARKAGRALEAWTGSDGRFLFTDVPLGVTVSIRAVHGPMEATPLVVPGDKPVPSGIRLELNPTASIMCTAFDEGTRKPRRSVRVRIKPVGEPEGRPSRSGNSNAKGEVFIGRLLPGAYEFVATHNEYVPGPPVVATVKAGDERVPVDLPLDPGLTIEGVVRNADGAAIRNCNVRVRGTEDGKNVRQRSVRSAADGTFRLTGYRGGTYTLNARHGSYRPFTQQALRGGERGLVLDLGAPVRRRR